jgi:ketosteroid isomerase-like protein
MSFHKDRVRTYFDGFRESDHEKILALLTDDVVWDIYGYRHLEGKEAFDGEIESEGFVGSPELTVDRLIEEGDTIAVPHVGKGTRSDGGTFRFAATTVFTFDSDLISHVESYVVPIQT